MTGINTVFLSVGLTLAVTANAVAHDTFVLPDKFRVSKGETVTVGFHSSDAFPESTQAMKRLQDPAIHAPGGPLPLANVREDGKRLVASFTVPSSGHLIVTAVNGTTTADMKADDFLDYLEEEGLAAIVESRAQRGEADKPAKERYTMFAKSILLADTPNGAYKQPVGLPIEIVPEKDPYRLKAGEALPVRVLFRGNPAANLMLSAASTATEDRKQHSIGRTDANGRIDVPVASGLWRLHVIQMERSAKPDADWESFWATLTFEIP